MEFQDALNLVNSLNLKSEAPKPEKKYNHSYKEGDLVLDFKFCELFRFSNKCDGFLAESSPSRLRLANEQETKLYLESGKEHFELPFNPEGYDDFCQSPAYLD